MTPEYTLFLYYHLLLGKEIIYMKKLIAIGEALIDFAPSQFGKKIKEVESFSPKTGGAPANVCGAFTCLGGTSEMITQLGNDPFGDKILDDFRSHKIGCSHVLRTDKANTSLAFVSLGADGNREFSFYRNPGADMLLSEEEIQKDWFQDCGILHFCSVSLGNFPMKEAHKKAILYAKEQGALISFDPNLRFALWNSPQELKDAVLEFLPYADILKISDEELTFITGENDIEKAKDSLLSHSRLIIYTTGSSGAQAYTRNVSCHADGFKVSAVDTTGAGDGFIGSFLYQLCASGKEIEDLSAEELQNYLRFSNGFCALSVQKNGAIDSYPKKEAVLQFIEK